MGLFGNNNDEVRQHAASAISIVRIKSFEDVQKYAEVIKNGDTLTFSLENLRVEEGQRVIDYLSGATYVLGGSIEKVTDKVYVSVPAGMGISNED